MGMSLTDWKLRPVDLKNYPHFDAPISPDEAVKLATDAKRVASHTFYPFMLFNNRWTKFAPQGVKGKEKTRPIRYAARSDAYIFSYYRHQLSKPYEDALQSAGIDNCILAYRKLRTPDGEGKCNIHFAKDAFEQIQKLGNCAVVALDISSFFEHLDHDRLRAMWCKLLGVASLPPDHERVFRAVTQYAVVEKQSVYQRLGHFGVKRVDSRGNPINGYLTPFNKIPMQLCTGKQFREKIAGGDGSKNLIDLNFKPYGIPQGSPISDLLANFYLFDFDIAVNAMAKKVGGAYFRYSDDILIVVPGADTEGLNVMSDVRKLIGTAGKKLSIKKEKCSVFSFKKKGTAQEFKLIYGTQGQNGIEYLGFRFDGKKVFLRDSTLSNLYRKIARSTNIAARRAVKRYPGKNATYIKARIDIEGLIQRFGRVKDFGEHSDEYKNWTFWTYAKRASKVFGTLGSPILRQLKNHREIVSARVSLAIEKALA